MHQCTKLPNESQFSFTPRGALVIALSIVGLVASAPGCGDLDEPHDGVTTDEESQAEVLAETSSGDALPVFYDHGDLPLVSVDEGVVPADEAPEFEAAETVITSLHGGTPKLVRGTPEFDAEDTGAQHGENEPTGPVNIVPNLFDSGEIYYNTGIGGTSFDRVVSKTCAGRTRQSANAFVYNNNGGHCSVVGWYTDDPSDCRFIVHVGASAFKHGVCAWSVYADELGYFSYNTSDTSSAHQNTTNASIYLAAGQTLTAATCGLAGSSATGDTYLRLFDGTTQVAQNDDACGGLSSSLVYTSPVDKRYELRAGCFSSGSCSGNVVWVKQP